MKKFHFCMPQIKNVSVVGSFLLDTMIESTSVDLAVEMPAGMFEADDCMNYRYFHKRAIFLARICEALLAMREMEKAKIEWVPFRGHALKPILAITLSESNLPIRIHIHTLLAMDTFKQHLQSADQGLVNVDAFLVSEHPMLQNESGLAEKLSMNETCIQTPIYSSLILSDMLLIEHLKLLHAECKRIPSLVEAIKLGKAWLQQRGYLGGAFHLSGFQLSMIMCYLARNNRIDASMTALHIFKATMIFIAETDWKRVLYFHSSSSGMGKGQEMMREASQLKMVAVLLEPIRGLNILYDWSEQVLQEIRHDANRALSLLAEKNCQLDGLFLRVDEDLCKFDVTFGVGEMRWFPEVKSNLAAYLDQYHPRLATLDCLARKLSFALGDRLLGLSLHLTPPTGNVVLEKGKRKQEHVVGKLRIGLRLDPRNCFRIVQLGPCAENVIEAQTFRSFWRERSELRRFKDGSLREAVAWEGLSGKRHLVVPDIVSFVLNSHFAIPIEDICPSLEGALDFALQNASFDQLGSFTTVISTFQSLSQKLCSLKGLPLVIVRCEAISSACRYTSLLPVLPLRRKGNEEADDLAWNVGRLPEHVPVIEGLVYLERSSRWPEDYYGLLYAKRAFMASICRQLEDEYGLRTSATLAYFDVLKDDFIFRLYLHHEKEASRMTSCGLDATQTVRLFEELPLHARAISALANRNPLFGPVTRLLKRWVGSQMLSLQIGEELIELLCAKVFLNVVSPPGSLISGLARVLELLATHPWSSEPLLVDFDADNGEEVTMIEGDDGKEKRKKARWSVEESLSNFHQKADSRPPMWIAPSYDSKGECSFWVGPFCTALAVKMIQKLAQAALIVLQDASQKGDQFDLPILFRRSLDNFDVIIYLQSEMVSKRNLRMSKITLGDEVNNHQPQAKPSKTLASLINTKASATASFLRCMPGFDSVECLLAELRSKLPQCDLYYDAFGGMEIGIVMSPESSDTTPIKETIMSVASDMVRHVKVRARDEQGK